MFSNSQCRNMLGPLPAVLFLFAANQIFKNLHLFVSTVRGVGSGSNAGKQRRAVLCCEIPTVPFGVSWVLVCGRFFCSAKLNCLYYGYLQHQPRLRTWAESCLMRVLGQFLLAVFLRDQPPCPLLLRSCYLLDAVPALLACHFTVVCVW